MSQIDRKNEEMSNQLYKSTDFLVTMYLCDWGNDSASEVLAEAHLLLVENYFQTPYWASVWPRSLRISGRAPSGVKPYKPQF